MPDLFTADTVCDLSPAEQTALLASTPERGGFSDLLRDLQGRIAGGRLTLSDTELRRVQLYAYGFGSGGWQRSFRAVLKAAWRAGWEA